MLNYFFIISLFAFWQMLFLGLSKFAEKSISKNIIHFIHALIFVVYYKLEYDISYLINLSTSFYIYDLIYIILQLTLKQTSIYSQGPFIVHHIIAIYGLYLSSLNISSNFLLMTYYILENSNFMLYISYHVNKTCNKFPNLVRSVEFLQYLWYSYFRVVYFTIYLVNRRQELYSHNNIMYYLLLTALYFMGLFWSYKLFIKNVKNISLLILENKPKLE